jgi:predicted permease
MSVYEQLLERRRKAPYLFFSVVLVVAVMWFFAARYPSPTIRWLWYAALVGSFAAISYLNSLFCCPRCRRQVLAWYGIGSKSIPRVCRVCRLDFSATGAKERTI